MLQRIFITTGGARAWRAAMQGDMQGLPERVLAPQRGLANIGPVLRR